MRKKKTSIKSDNINFISLYSTFNNVATEASHEQEKSGYVTFLNISIIVILLFKYIFFK